VTIKTLEDVRAAVEAIRNSAEDAEGAHSAEDDLWEAVLRSIAADACPDPKAWAAEAMKTQEIDFQRWGA
jgi:hypothetical protein